MGTSATLPTGTVTFLFTDIEGSTRLARELGEHYDTLLDVHRTVIRAAIATNHGVEVACPGDGFVIAFADADDALQAARAAQRGLTATRWPEHAAIRVRMGLHSGSVRVTTTGGTYVGVAVHEAARVMDAAHGGQVLVSDATAGLLPSPARAELVDLGVHRLRDLDQPRRLFQVSGGGLQPSFGDLRGADPAHRLPPARSLVGRAEAVVRVLDALDGARLVTLLGPGGVGKTALALRAAHDGPSVNDTWFIDLAALPAAASAAVLASAVGRVLGIDTAGEITALTTALRGQRAVVILDNCEHVIDAVATVVSEVIDRSPEIKLLATSREPLGVRGETLVDVAPLAADAAAELFRVRAADLATDVSADPEGVRRACDALDGLPLAIELAARRTRILSPTAIADRLDDRFRLLGVGERDRVARHATLEATVGWSHDLLDDPQRVIFRRLAVFTGGWTVEAAEAVCGGAPLTPHDVLDLLSALVDRSLVVVQDDRFTMLETLRAYALARLEEAGEAAKIADAHLRWTAALVERCLEEALFAASGRSEHQVITELAAEAANLQAAAQWAIAGSGDPDLGITTVSVFGWLGWVFGAGHGEAEAWINALLPRLSDPLRRAGAMLAAANALGPDALDYASRAIALASDHVGGELYVLTGRSVMWAVRVNRGGPDFDLDEARRELALLSRDFHARGMTSWEALTVAFGATTAFAARDDEVGLALAEEGVALARRAGSSIALARCLENVGRGLARLGDHAGALDAVNEAVAVAQAGNAVGEEGIARSRLSRLAARRGDYEECMAQLDQTIALFERAGMWGALALARAGASAAALLTGSTALAREHAQELMAALRMARDLDLAPALMAQPARAAREMGDEALAKELEALALMP